MDGVVADGDAVCFGFRESCHDIGGHEGMGFVSLPPAPAAIRVFEAIETIETGLYFLVERVFV